MKLAAIAVAAVLAFTTSAQSTSAKSMLAGCSSTSENDVKTNGCCKDVTIIFARGTGESGNVGSVVGPPFFNALKRKLGCDRVAVQGVDYAASVIGNMSGGLDGGPEMARMVEQALERCSDTKIILSGYSQGGMVVHNTAHSVGTKVAGGKYFAIRVQGYCH
jgi:cutinase